MGSAALLAFLGGFAMMVLEIVGARFLAPDFGGSFYVWVSQIGVILGALAAGYFAGGALADRFDRPIVLAVLLVPAGLFTWFIPDFAPVVLGYLVERHPAGQSIPVFWQKADPVLGSIMVFLLPGFILATLSPFLIRLASVRLAEVGRVSGGIFAAGTVGGIVGVFGSGYVLLDYLRLSVILRGTGILTVVLGGICIWLDRGARLEHTGK